MRVLGLSALAFTTLLGASLPLAQSGAGSASGSDPNSEAGAKQPPYTPALAPWRDDPGTAPQQDPKALEILNAGLKAAGGVDAILGRKTIYIKRKITNHEYPEPRVGTITVWCKRPDKIRKEISYPDQKHIEVFDGRRAWFDGGQGPQFRGATMTAIIYDGMKELDIPANYLDADLTYFNISQEIPGKLAHVVKVRKNGYTKELMFDVTTHLLEVSGEYENPWGAADKMQKFDRYRPVDGIMVPHRIENWRSNRMVSETEILEIKFNGPVDDALFMVPSNTAPPHQPQASDGARKP